MVRRGSAVAICVAAFLLFMLGLPITAYAQPQIIERVRLQGGYITEVRPSIPRFHDYWIGAVPELTALWLTPRVLTSVSYQLTGAFHTLTGASEIANRVILSSAYEVTRRANLILGAEAAQTTVSNFLIQRPASDTPIVLYPAAGTRFITGRLNQGLRYELSPVVMGSQEASITATTTLPPSPPLDTFISTLGLGVERVWRNDALGFFVRGNQLLTRATLPTPSTNIYTITAAPGWRHDWSRSLTSSVSAGASYLFSPDPDTSPTVAPYAEANALYTVDPTTINVTYRVGVFPSLLTGQTLRSQQVLVRALTPLSEHYRVMLGASIGYLRGELIDLRASTNDQAFDTVSADADVTWQATGHMQVFGRYLFIIQRGDTSTEAGINSSFLRDAVIVGVLISSESTRVTVPTGFSQRVDGTDAPFRATNARDRDAAGGAARYGGGGGTGEEGPPEPAGENETAASGSSVEGLPGMWHTRPSRPAGPAPTNQNPNAPPPRNPNAPPRR